METLTTSDGTETPYRVDELVASGDAHQIARAHHQEQGRDVAVRTVLYGADATDDEIAFRRRQLREQWEFLQDVADAAVAPTPVEWLEVEDSPVEQVPEPLIVCELVEGPTLYEWVSDKHAEGLGLQRALSMVDELAAFLQVVHEAGWLWRDFDPRRFIVADEDERLRAVSVSAVMRRRGESAVMRVNEDYTAPEVRQPADEKLRRPAADLYGVGALLSFLVTGEQPRHRVESPISFRAYEKVHQHDEPGLELLLARLLQPRAQRRMESAEQLRQFCSVETLPGEQTEGFEDCRLPTVWEGMDIEEPEQHRGLQSSLSEGPLVSVAGDGEAQEAPQPPEPSGIDWRVVAVVVVVVVVVVGVGVWVGR